MDEFRFVFRSYPNIVAVLVAIDTVFIWSGTNMSGVGCLFAFPPLNDSKASPRRSFLPMLPKGPFFLCTILESELQVIYTP